MANVSNQTQKLMNATAKWGVEYFYWAGEPGPVEGTMAVARYEPIEGRILVLQDESLFETNIWHEATHAAQWLLKGRGVEYVPLGLNLLHVQYKDMKEYQYEVRTCYPPERWTIEIEARAVQGSAELRKQLLALWEKPKWYWDARKLLLTKVF